MKNEKIEIENTILFFQEAAIMAFGSILDGPDPSKLTPLVQQAIPALINSMSDPNVS